MSGRVLVWLFWACGRAAVHVGVEDKRAGVGHN
jgi:hypothetical protein